MFTLIALGVGAASGFAAALVGIGYLVRSGHLRLRFDAGRPSFTVASGDPTSNPISPTTLAPFHESSR